MTSRPMSRVSAPSRSGIPPLPQIKHPLAAGPRGCDLAVLSHRATDGRGSNHFSRSGALPRPDFPLASHDVTERQYTFRGAGQEAVDSRVCSPAVGDRDYIDIANKPKLRDQIAELEKKRPSSRVSQASSASTGIQLRLDVDEIELLIREKARSNPFEVQKRFRDNDSQGIGSVSREALQRVFVTLITRPISHLVFQKLLLRFGLENKPKVHFNDIIAGTTAQSKKANWITNTKKQTAENFPLTANQVHAVLKDRAKQRVLDLYDLVPQTNPDGARRLMKPEFRNAIARLLQVNMSDEQFDKLWQKYDLTDTGVIDAKHLASKLGIEIEEMGSNAPTPQPKSNCLRKKEEDRERSLTIDKWLKSRFRIAYNAMRSRFAVLDGPQRGFVSPEEFCEVLHEQGLSVKRENVDELLARCGVVRSTEGVPYLEFLKSYQDRSEAGMAHRILTDPRHRYNYDDRPPTGASHASNESWLSSIEAQLMNLFQRDFLSLLGRFHEIDEHGQGFITQQSFRDAIESAFRFTLTNEQYSRFLDHVPLTRDGHVKYADFMGQFDAKGDAVSMVSGSALEATEEPMRVLDTQSHRDPEQLTAEIRDLMTRDSELVDRVFMDMDCYNTQRLTQEDAFNLLSRCGLRVSRGEIRDLWLTLITNRDDSLSWLQFIRQFSFSGQTHTYTDAGKNPPTWGDSDFLLKSNTLNSDLDYLKDSTRHSIEYKMDELRRALTSQDPHMTGCVSERLFSKTVGDICVHLSVFDLSQIIQQYLTSDGRVNYSDFLCRFGRMKPVWSRGNEMFDLLRHEAPSLGISDITEHPQHGLIGLSARLRNKLSGNWKNLRRAFKKLDKESSGYLPLSEFRQVLQLANVVLDEDEVYHMMSQLDESLTGRLNYNKFLGELFRPESQQSSRAPSVRLISRLSNLSRRSVA